MYYSSKKFDSIVRYFNHYTYFLTRYNSRLIPIYVPYITNAIIKFNDVKHYNDTLLLEPLFYTAFSIMLFFFLLNNARN